MKTHTFAILELSPQAYAEIRMKLLAADYRHCFNESSGQEVIDMNGIAIQSANAGKPQTTNEPAQERQKPNDSVEVL
jgi:hypothetical protein